VSGSEELQGLDRGLRALVFLNENGLTTLAALARHLGAPRATTYRIINTLAAAGYCTRIPHSRFYQATAACRRLSQGVNEAEILTSVGIAVVEALGEEVKWPVTLTAPHGSHMLVRFTTDRTTPLALSRFNPGFEADMLRTTTGLLYLALERPEVSRRLIAEILSGPSRDRFDLGEGALDARLEACRRDGYLILAPGARSEASVGVPIVLKERPIGGLVMRYVRSALPRAVVVETYLPRLRAAAAEILRLYQLAAERAGEP